MTLLVGGAFAAVFGLIGFLFWWSDFITIVRGGGPLLLFFGGMLAAYIGFDEIQDKLREEHQYQAESLAKAHEEIEMIRIQAEQYKEELDKLKEEKKNHA